jgi:hypothetical protein
MGAKPTSRSPARTSEFDPTRTSALRHPGQSHALNHTVAPGKESRNVAPCVGGITKAANGEIRIERKSRLHCGPRFVQLPEPRQRSRENEMRGGMVSVCVKSPAQPDDCFGIGTELHLGEADDCHPSMGKNVARRKAECLIDVRSASAFTADTALLRATWSFGLPRATPRTFAAAASLPPHGATAATPCADWDR